MISETFWTNFLFHIMFRFWRMTSCIRHFAVFQYFFDEIPVLGTISWFQALFIMIKILSMIREIFWKYLFFISCPVYDVWRHLLPSFCRFSVICWLNPFLGTLSWFIKEVYHRKSCSAWLEIHFEKNSSYDVPYGLKMSYSRHFAYFSNFKAQFPF